MPEIIDIFRDNAFGVASMTQAVDKVPYKPSRLGELGLFVPNRLRTDIVGIEEREGAISLIKTSPRGAPLEQRKGENRNMRYMETVRIAKGDTIRASELAFVREFGQTQQVKAVATELARRMSGPTGLVAEVELTWEHMRLGAIQGEVLDADGSVIINWYDFFGLKKPTAINFDLAAANPAEGALRKAVQASVVRAMQKKAKGARYAGVHALCGDQFWDGLIAHPEVRETYLNQVAAAELRQSYDGEVFHFAGVDFERYRGTDDDATVSLAADQVRFFPKGAGNSVFEVAYAPGETFADLGSEGKELYAMVLPDTKRQQKVELEVYSYPLHICKRPEMLLLGKA